MISVRYPDLIPFIQDIPFGLIPIDLEEDGARTLLVKTTKEAVLAVKINKVFSIYFVSIEINQRQTYSLVSAFFDNEDEPLIIFRRSLKNRLTN